MKKSIFILFFAMLNVLSARAYDFKVKGIFYNRISGTDNQVEVTGISYDKYPCLSPISVTIPATVKYRGNTYHVTSIGEAAFKECNGLSSVTIPESVTSIGSSAFGDCGGLTSVEWNAVACQDFEYNSYPFYNCENITYITFGNQVTHIPAYLCYKLSGLTSMTIPENVTSIGKRTFSGCTGLTSVTIPESVTSIGSSAFENCSDLTSITIPESVTSIGFDAFSGCTSISSPLYNSKVFAYMPQDYSGEYKITSGIQSIVGGAFEGCMGLISVTIPESVTSIGSSAFMNCSGLTSITIPEGVSSIKYQTFYGCRGLTSVKIPNSVTSIGDYAFMNCSGLTSITIPENVTSIEYSAFSGCSGLTSLTISEGVTTIGRRAFAGCTGLTSVTIPNSVTAIGERTFSGCTGLTSVTIPESVTSISSSAFENCNSLTTVQDLENELREYFYPFPSPYPSYHLYFRTPDNADATMTMVTEYVAGINILNEVGTIGPRMKKTRESFFAYINSGGEMKTIKKTATVFYVNKEWRALVGLQQNSHTIIGGRQVDDQIILFVLPSGSNITKWKESVNGETYTCTAQFTDISFWENGKKLYRKAIKISKSTRLDNGKEVKEWSYWVKELSKLATYGYWGNPNQISCIEKSMKIDIDKPITEISKK